MSGNENVSGTNGGVGPADAAGHTGAGWGWEPVPQGGEYDSEATAFVKLPQDMLDALDGGEPLAAPGHGYVPPPMIVPLGSASTDPTATGTWTMPVPWPEAGGSDGGGGGATTAEAAAPARGPIPASIPLPASVAAAFADAAQGGTGRGEAGPGQDSGHETDPGATAEWRFPEAAQPEEPQATGQWTFGTGAAAADWSQAPATLPGGAAAPWATPAYDNSLSSGVLPGGQEAGAAAGTSGLPGASAAFGRGPRVLGGPGVGTPLPVPAQPDEPEPEPVVYAAPDIEAAHGAARMPAEEERPRPVGAEPGPGDGDLDGDLHGRGHGFGVPVAEAGPAAPETAAETRVEPGPGSGSGPEAGFGVPGSGTGPEPEPGHGFDGAAQGTAGEAAEPFAPDAGNTDSGEALPGAETTAEFPAGDATYDETPIGAPAPHHEHPLASYVLRVNGADRPVTGAWIGESLLYVLRERLGLAGAKDGCSQGECGACAVQVDGRLVASCLVPAATAASSEVRTVEGLATDGELSDVQQALCRSGAVQCGFCVPGMAMTIHDLLEGNHAPSELETRQALCGNLCRCSGYKGVIEAVREVVAERSATASATALSAAPSADGSAAGAEPRIPHQAAPGEGGIHHNGGMA
ncbi:2Fe-2S iron-sulfur cluster-binding protein [Streptomyces sp. NPDC051130]|uniref:2Fe-2S iron-sulfur cluster-binding protein n=1 Tax=Streptomyces sp. NPDC051130 TaxID=3157223 RepID=UPI0034189CD5